MPLPDPAPEPEPDPEPDADPDPDPSLPTLRTFEPSSDPHATVARAIGTTASRAASLGTRMGPPGHGSANIARKANRTSRASWQLQLGDRLPAVAAQAHLAAVGARDGGDDREAQARSAGPRAVGAAEALRRPRQEVGRDPGPVVADDDADDAVLPPRAHLDGRRSVSQRVVDQVPDGLLQPQVVPGHPKPARRHRDPVPPARGPREDLVDRDVAAAQHEHR